MLRREARRGKGGWVWVGREGRYCCCCRYCYCYRSHCGCGPPGGFEPPAPEGRLSRGGGWEIQARCEMRDARQCGVLRRASPTLRGRVRISKPQHIPMVCAARGALPGPYMTRQGFRGMLTRRLGRGQAEHRSSPLPSVPDTGAALQRRSRDDRPPRRRSARLRRVLERDQPQSSSGGWPNRSITLDSRRACCLCSTNRGFSSVEKTAP